MEEDVLRTGDIALIEAWRKLQTSDHFYYMCTKWFSDGDVHAYFSPYESPYDAYIAFMNALSDLQWRVSQVPRREVTEEAQVLIKTTFWSRVLHILNAWQKKIFDRVVFIRKYVVAQYISLISSYDNNKNKKG